MALYKVIVIFKIDLKIYITLLYCYMLHIHACFDTLPLERKVSILITNVMVTTASTVITHGTLETFAVISRANFLVAQ